jgi:hypothetical protein
VSRVALTSQLAWGCDRPTVQLAKQRGSEGSSGPNWTVGRSDRQ